MWFAASRAALVDDDDGAAVSGVEVDGAGDPTGRCREAGSARKVNPGGRRDVGPVLMDHRHPQPDGAGAGDVAPLGNLQPVTVRHVHGARRRTAARPAAPAGASASPQPPPASKSLLSPTRQWERWRWPLPNPDAVRGGSSAVSATGVVSVPASSPAHDDATTPTATPMKAIRRRTEVCRIRIGGFEVVVTTAPTDLLTWVKSMVHDHSPRWTSVRTTEFTTSCSGVRDRSAATPRLACSPLLGWVR